LSQQHHQAAGGVAAAGIVAAAGTVAAISIDNRYVLTVATGRTLEISIRNRHRVCSDPYRHLWLIKCAVGLTANEDDGVVGTARRLDDGNIALAASRLAKGSDRNGARPRLKAWR
jgi:hypothetical protein